MTKTTQNKQVVSTKSEKTGTVTNPVVDRAAMEKLIVARISMIMHQPFFGNIVTRLVLENADSWCPTAACDGRKIYYNSEFVNKLKDKEVVFLVAHEMFHAIYDHVGINGRCGDRIPMLWNIAADYAINGDLVDYRIGERITTVPTLYDAKYKGKCSEEIYDELYENADKVDIEGLGEMVLDVHLDGDGEDGQDGEGNGNGRPKLSSEEKQQIADELKEAMLSAAQAVGAGNVPNGMKRFIDGLTEPKMNWREILTQQIESQIKNDFTFMRPSRRGWGCDAILPSMKKEPSVECDVFIDTSGSISGAMIKDFLGEVKGIMDQHASFRIRVGTFDTQVYNIQEFTEDTADELLSYEPQGGGGTMFECVFNWYKEQSIVPKQLCIFTDGYPCGTWGEEDYCETVFLVHKNKDIIAPFGVTVNYE